LINIVSSFIEQKKSALEIVNNGSIQSEQMTVADPLVIKRRGRPATKRLKASSENQGHKAFVNHAINPQDPNLVVHAENDRVPLSNINTNSDSNNDKKSEESNNNKRKKYVCKICGEIGHNSRNKAKCKQQEQQEFHVE